MNILFLTLLDFETLEERNLYTDLLREFEKENHKLYVISPVERRKNCDTHIVESGNTTILRLKIGNTQKTNIIEKGISTLSIEPLFINGIKKYFSNVKFDLVLYSTPPITFCNAIEYVKKRDGAMTYLLLKDIFPQNSVDLNMLSKSGLKGILYKYFRNKEKKLYSLSDKIGCMSPANVKYLLDHNPQVKSEDTEVCPNSAEPVDMSATQDEKIEIRKKYNLPLDKKIFVYGGNLGRPQGVDFIIECLKKLENSDSFFLIVGDGTEYSKLENYINDSKPSNIKLMQRIPKADYDRMIGSCDVGLIFLDFRFTIPNYPSRLLSYLQAGIPVLASTDMNTDIGEFIVSNNIGDFCPSNDSDKFVQMVEKIKNKEYSKEYIQSVGEKHFNTKDGYNIIMRNFNENSCK